MPFPDTLREWAAFGLLTFLLVASVAAGVVAASLVDGPLGLLAAVAGAVVAVECLRRPIGVAVGRLVARL